jgi:CTP synthase (UTP-ammonia lyase)
VFQTGNSIMRQMYGNMDYIEERHRHRYIIPVAIQNTVT